MILTGDAFACLATLKTESVQCCVTSPPYWGLRDYGVDGQVGMETTPDAYIGQLRMIFDQVKRILNKDGTLWLNLGDSYAAAKASKAHEGMAELGKHFRGGGHKATTTRKPGRHKVKGLHSKDLVGVPWRVALALQSDGWHLRQDIVWNKPNAMPESVTDRCTKSHEYIFLLTKSPRYYFDHKAIQEPAICGAKGSEFHTGKTGDHQMGRAQKVRPSMPKGSFKAKGEPLPGQLPFRAVVDMRNKRSVWTVSTTPFKGAHFATFPPALIEPCILAGSRPGDVILDPFFGAGTTGLVAQRLDRKYIGIELNPEYAQMAVKRIEGDKPAPPDKLGVTKEPT